MKIIHQILILFVVFINQALASDTGYEVEVIIFEDISGKYIHNENWPNLSSEETLSNEVKTSENPGTETSDINKTINEVFTLVDASNFKLNNHKTRISDNSNYKVLFHTAWKQKGLDRENAIPFYIDSRKNDQKSLYNQKMTQVDSNNLNIINNDNYIKGNITLILSRYLHFETNLVFYKKSENIPPDLITDNTNSDLNQDKYSQYSVKFERRMRSREVHYIDHPIIGILVLATPFVIPDELQEENPKL